MKKINVSLFKNTGLVQLLFVGVFISILIGANILINNKSTSSQNPSASSPLHKELQAVYDKIPTLPGKLNFLKQSNNLTKKVDPELTDLDSQIITCGASVDSLLSSSPSYAGSCVGGAGTLSSTKGMTLGGQCCGTLMDTSERHANLQKLQAYKTMPDIILDPMHTPITLAKKWIDYDNSTTLTSDEQKIYDQAMTISKEKPCCCKCWHYYTNEGIAKKMIKDGTYNSKQIADYWDASQICGV
ncbi:MAG TPA: hypothetical protein VNW29_04840 [Candidatus Sulfotelmatobacter sp.]|jgi:hypothetical protein|nr:hypothetical protein [Candidatus Sulfotelmatobacter sp.]